MKYLTAGIICVLIFIGGFLFGRFTAGAPGANFANPFPSSGSEVQDNNAAAGGEGVTVDASQMTEGQRQMLRAMGIDPNSITITAEMVACAEAKIGVARVEEIKNGATPTLAEGGILLGCYQ